MGIEAFCYCRYLTITKCFYSHTMNLKKWLFSFIPESFVTLDFEWVQNGLKILLLWIIKELMMLMNEHEVQSKNEASSSHLNKCHCYYKELDSYIQAKKMSNHHGIFSMCWVTTYCQWGYETIKISETSPYQK